MQSTLHHQLSVVFRQHLDGVLCLVPRKQVPRVPYRVEVSQLLALGQFGQGAVLVDHKGAVLRIFREHRIQTGGQGSAQQRPRPAGRIEQAVRHPCAQRVAHRAHAGVGKAEGCQPAVAFVQIIKLLSVADCIGAGKTLRVDLRHFGDLAVPVQQTNAGGDLVAGMAHHAYKGRLPYAGHIPVGHKFRQRVMGQIGLGAVCPAHPAEGLVAEAVQILVVCTAEDPHSHLVQHTGMGAVCVPHYKRHAVAVLTVFQRVNRVGQHHQGKNLVCVCFAFRVGMAAAGTGAGDVHLHVTGVPARQLSACRRIRFVVKIGEVSLRVERGKAHQLPGVRRLGGRG